MRVPEGRTEGAFVAVESTWPGALLPGPSEVNAEALGLRQHALAIFRSALRAVDPEAAVARHLSLCGDTLRVGAEDLALHEVERIWVVAFGKASVAMARAVEKCLGEWISGGLVVAPHGSAERLERLEVTEASHPLPGPEGEAAARRVVQLLRDAGERDLVLCLISGGGSALLPLPAEDLTLQDKVSTTDLLLRSGATIVEVNAVRKHLSGLKGGRLARVAYPARVIALVMSDVVGDRLDTIASGPLSPDPTTYADALAVLERYGLLERVPARVREHLRRGAVGELPETPKPGDPVFERVTLHVVASVAHAVEAAREEAERLGYRVAVLTVSLEGEAREVGRVVAAVAREEVQRDRPLPKPACVLLGGETTVTVRGRGRGGRNQELTLAAALGIEGLGAVLVASFASDGRDGPTDAAGALADGSTTQRARALGLDPRRYLEENDSYAFFDALGDLVRTGPTGTNVNDLVLVLAH